jgi:hypothetical protein
MPSTNDAQILSRLVKRMQNREEDPLRPLVDAYLLARDASPERLRTVELPLVGRPRPPGRLSPSKVGGCQRAGVFSFIGVKGRRRLDPDSELVLERGNWIHHQWQALFRDMERVLGKQTFRVISIEGPATIDELYIAGHYDAIVKIHGVRWLIDIKSINSFGFNRVTMDDQPLPHHIEQLITYMKAKGIQRGLLWYDCKDNSQTHGFTVAFSPDEWAKVEEWCAEVVNYMERKRLPNRDHECQAGTFMYERCPYAGLCFGRKDHEDLRQLAYRRFPGVEAQWEAGHRTMEEHDAAE